MTSLSKLALIAAASLAMMSSAALAQQKTFNIWWFEGADSSEGIAWTKALDEFKAAHPDVTVNFQQKTFAQLQASGSMILNSDQAPDVLEYNKGNATAGLVSSQGLLTNLDDYVTKEGWDKILNEGDLVLSKYDDKGIYGSGHVWGISVYGEYVSCFYNIDMFDKAGLKVPTTLDEWVADMEAFKKQGMTPLALGAIDTSGQHLLASLAYTKADDTWVQNYQGLKAPLDGAPYLYAAQTLLDWVSKGYISKGLDRHEGSGRRAAVHLGQGAHVRLGHLEPRRLLFDHQGLQVGPVRDPDAEVLGRLDWQPLGHPQGRQEPRPRGRVDQPDAVAEVPDRDGQ